ncbi:hypothetical protein PLCT2_01541 [Planctomycetaceae bacterium]|nr:hypothetical protein PLCT2_01541 [Planctomycetaceae bacterium]
MPYPTLYNLPGRKWTIRTSVLKAGTWSPTLLTSYEVAQVQNNVATLKTVMMDKEGKELPTNAVLAQFPRKEPILQPFKFWMPENVQLFAERRESAQCSIGNFDCWLTDFHDPARKDSRIQMWASIGYPGLIVREQGRWLSDEIDEKTKQLIKTHEINELKELVAFSG